MSNNDTALTELAGAVLDGTPINWDAADFGAAAPDRALVRQLKAIAAIACAQRSDMPDTWGPLRLLERLGQGAFGDVYRAWDSRLDREVALKLLPADYASSDARATSIIEEGRLLARVRHPNVVTIYGAERIDGRVGLWMEYVDGRTLHQLVVEDRRRFSTREVATIGQALCGAVAAVHAAGLLHRDIKAQNVMMARDGRVALMDFGAGRERSEESAAGLAGTPLYLSPEVLTGTSGPSIQADVYSTGVLLFFLLTGSYPVTGDDLVGLQKAHERGERRVLNRVRPDVPRTLQRAIDRAIDPDPARRYASAEALASALAGSLAARWKVVASGLAAAVLVFAALLSAPSGAPLPSVGRPQVAVLSFANRSADPDEAQFADGLTAEIIRNLGAVSGLDVRSHSSSSAFKQTQPDIVDVGRKLDVGYVLDGSIARAGGRLRVDVRLLQADGVVMWSKPYERDLTVAGIVSIQDEIARAVVNSLKLTVDHPQRRYATNLDNYEDYLQARALADRQGVTAPAQAVKLFEKVIASDPTYAPAHAGMVLAYAYLSMAPYQGVPFAAAHVMMRASAFEAVRLDPMLAEAHAALGWVHAREFNWVDAEAAFRRAIELNPGLTFSYTSFSFSTLQPLDRVIEAEQLLRAAERIDPFAMPVQLALARVLMQAHRPSEAITILDKLRRTDPDISMVDVNLGRALVLDGRAAEAVPLLERQQARLVDPSDRGRGPWSAWAYVALGRRAEAESLARADDRMPYRRAIINAALGNPERMFHGMEEMAEHEPQRLVQLLRSPELDAYRDDERFTRLLRRVNLEPAARRQ